MTDNDIIKALECCTEFNFVCRKNCPMTNDKECMQHLRKYAYDLINRQKAEKDKAWGLCKMRTDEKIELQMLCDKQKAEIERLRKFLDMSRNVSLARRDENIRKDELMIKMSAECKTAKAEAIKEFAERLKELLEGEYIKATNPLENAQNIVVSTNIKIVDNLIKEMVGDKK